MLVLNLFIIKTRMVKLQSNKVQKLIERPYLLTKNVHIFKGSKIPVPLRVTILVVHYSLVYWVQN